MSDKKEPFKDAWDEFLKTIDGEGLADTVSLGEQTHSNQYLRNRLWRAFSAGWNARGAITGDNGANS